MLSVKQILQNKDTFLSTNKTYNVLTDELLNFLGENLYTAPATTNLDMFGCYPGGLLKHMITSCTYSIHINNLLPENLRLDKTSIVRCAFITHIGKVFLYKENTNEWSKKTLKKMYEFNNDLVSMKANERAVYYATNYGVKLTEIEYQAIIAQESENKMPLDNLAIIIKQGIEMSILIDKSNK